MGIEDRTYHLHVNLFYEHGTLQAHALELRVSVEAEGISAALRKLADEIDETRAVENKLDGKLAEVSVKHAGQT